MNGFYRDSDASLEAIATLAAGILSEASSGYPTSKAQADALVAASETFGEGLVSAKAAFEASKAATAAKDAGRADVLLALASVSATLYAPDSGVTDEQLRAIGFAPRRAGSPRPKAAQTVANLKAALGGEGTQVRLSWSRGLNARTAIFQVEASTGGAWSLVGSTGRVSIALPATPGVATWYRIVTTTATTVSAPSAPVSVYGPVASSPALRVA